MYTVPTDFAKRLDREFRGRLRLRWSNRKQEFQLEQKVRRALAEGPVKDSQDDDGIRRRDGYLYLLSVRPGTRMPCPRCNTEVRVPEFEFREVSCPMCKLAGREHRFSAGYFPLTDLLIDHLKTLDPEREATRRLRDQVNAANTRLQQQSERQVLDRMADAVTDDFTRIAGIPMTGYTGKEFRG